MNDYAVGDEVMYDAGEGTDRWEVVDVCEGRVELRNFQGATTTYYPEGDEL